MSSSCEKTELLPISTNETQLSDKDFGIKVEQFRTKVLDSRKNGSTETIHVAEAVTMMEAAFNYYHAFTGEDYTFTITDTTIIPLNYNNNDVIPFSELQTIFVNANNSMADKFEALKMANKHTMMFDLELKNNELYVMMTAGTVETQKVAQECINEAPFGETDYWYPGDFYDFEGNPEYVPAGQCGPYAGLNVGISDARMEQEKAARKYRRGNYNHYNYYFTDVEKHDWTIYDYGLFQGGSTQCISPEEMNQHYQAIGNGINYYYEDLNITENKQFANIGIYNDIYVGGLHYQTIIRWLTFGVKRERVMPVEALSRM